MTGTMGNLLTQWVKYLSFCIYFNFLAIPASEEVLAAYAQHLSYSFKAYGSVLNYLCGVKTLHKFLNASLLGFQGFKLKLAMKGLKRNMIHIPRQAVTLTPAILCDIRSTLDLQNPWDGTFWAMCLVGFFLLLRKSNLVPVTLGGYDPSKQLARGDFEWLRDRVLVTLSWTKTNQFGKKEVYSLPRIPGSVLCPYSAVKHMFKLVPGLGICFQQQDGNPVTYNQFQGKLHTCLNLAGYWGDLFSSHSLRRGGTTFAFMCGVPTDLIKNLGGWSSDCYYRYLEFPLEAKAAATDLMKFRIQAMQW